MRDTLHRTLAAVVACALTLGFVAPVALADEDGSYGTGLYGESESNVSWTRLAGKDRYETMEKVVEEQYASAQTVVVASGENYPDALAATAVAGALKCPLVLTPSTYLSSYATNAIESVGAVRAVVVSGEGGVTEDVEEALAGLGVSVVRSVRGDTRQEMSLEAMRYIRETTPDSDTVIVASGHSFADALSAGPYAWSSSSPILLCDASGNLSEEQLAAIRTDAGIRRVVVVGGPAVVSGDVVDTFSSDHETLTLAGADRYETSKAIAVWEQGMGIGFRTPVVASGKNFPDALAGAASAGAKGSVLVLADSLDNPTVALLREHEADISGGYLLGGTKALKIVDPLKGLMDGAGTRSPDIAASSGAHGSGVQGLIDFMVKACSEWSLGYDQTDRWNVYDGGECDCASLFYTAAWAAGILPEPAEDERVGMCSTVAGDLMAQGWRQLSADLESLQPGDVLLNESDHVAVVVSGYGTDAMLAQGSGDENGGYSGGASGDQLQYEEDYGETNITRVYELWSGWDMILRAPGA